ncbi:flagellar hook-length control protein FliK [Acidovorax sp.]|uniref:flagellar hook-length control protein FliK n=1 Tax=Acidovorax sp. TaxID=1872122 RepID=UPI00391ADAB0
MEGPHTQEMEGVDAAAVFGDPAQAAAEDQVAEQVTYWVNQKTQNAELTLQREGQPVEVSVSLSGNEAHVTFRSDQAETRELLDRSMSQLSELLRSEGLVLSGMSVGTSARDGGGAGEAGQQRQREGGRQAQVVSSASAAGNAAAAREGVARDGTVDIFV